MATTAYCTEDDIENRLSTTGVTLRTDDTPPTALGDVIDDASTLIDEHCRLRYTPAVLAASDWVNQRATDLAACLLCERRGNPPPASIQRKHDRAMERLELVRRGLLQIPDVGMRKSEVPVLSNQRVRLDPHPRVQTQKSKSTGTQEGYKTNNDRFDYDYSI